MWGDVRERKVKAASRGQLNACVVDVAQVEAFSFGPVLFVTCVRACVYFVCVRMDVMKPYEICLCLPKLLSGASRSRRKAKKQGLCESIYSSLFCICLTGSDGRNMLAQHWFNTVIFAMCCLKWFFRICRSWALFGSICGVMFDFTVNCFYLLLLFNFVNLIWKYFIKFYKN